MIKLAVAAAVLVLLAGGVYQVDRLGRDDCSACSFAAGFNLFLGRPIHSCAKVCSIALAVARFDNATALRQDRGAGELSERLPMPADQRSDLLLISVTTDLALRLVSADAAVVAAAQGQLRELLAARGIEPPPPAAVAAGKN